MIRKVARFVFFVSLWRLAHWLLVVRFRSRVAMVVDHILTPSFSLSCRLETVSDGLKHINPGDRYIVVAKELLDACCFKKNFDSSTRKW